MAKRLNLPTLARTWQILMKGLGEVQASPAALQAAEMVLIRLCYTADLPPPVDLVKQLQVGLGEPAIGKQVIPSNGDAGQAVVSDTVTRNTASTEAPAPDPVHQLPTHEPTSFRDLVELFGTHNELTLQGHLIHNVHLIQFEPGGLTIRPASKAPRDLNSMVLQCLHRWLGSHWRVLTDDSEGEPTLATQDGTMQDAHLSDAMQNPVVQAVMETFPSAEVTRITPCDGTAPGSKDGNSPDTTEKGSAT